ncbi:STAS domain-containing protein [Streptomyces sp. HC44]|uniref:Anti-sigma factor antagonist n=1 Tax=Streptomyces scabichelini TaxID=2711217 RepID=A0A6G4VMU3_9ACTN|nr:STAS domain-containing protein [Streptomyces scabichelini]NGO15449.1 STAS domain-containing protein [Streptomyces scabichelini]
MGTHHFTFALHHREAGESLVLELSGEIDAWAYAELLPPLAEVLDGSYADVVVDLRPVTFLDAGGLRLLLRIKSRVDDHQGTLRLVRGTPRVWRIMRLTRLDDAFTVLDGPPASLRDQGVPARMLS